MSRSAIMSFSGKYQLQSQENFEPFMKAVGLPDDTIQKGKDIKSITEIEENGDNFKVVITTGSNVITNVFTIGQETELQTMTGDKIKGVVNREGNKLKASLQVIESVTELVDPNTLVDTMILGDIVYKRINKRI